VAQLALMWEELRVTVSINKSLGAMNIHQDYKDTLATTIQTPSFRLQGMHLDHLGSLKGSCIS
jgi:hypothetical protein